MGTGIVSVALSLDGHQTLSKILLVITAVMWVALGALVPLRARGDRAEFVADLRTPAALTGVAGTAVLGARLTMLGWTWSGIVAVAIAAVVWVLLLGPVLRHWRTPTVGGSLVLAVATESLALLTALLAGDRARAMAAAWPRSAPSSAARRLCFYVFVIARFDRAS